MSQIKTKVVLATRPANGIHNGLITFEIDVPYFVWVEILTHKRFARNASSARAQKLSRHTENGYYVPDTFYKDQRGMQSSDDPIQSNDFAKWIYDKVWLNCLDAAEQLEELGVCKEQINRVIPPIKMIKGIMTGTEDAWDKFLELRTAKNADKAMQEFANSIRYDIGDVNWEISNEHFPYRVEGENVTIMELAARIARVSYSNPGTGKTDTELGKMLLENKHLSPFEHIAVWKEKPKVSAICSKINDFLHSYDGKHWGWENFRSQIE